MCRYLCALHSRPQLFNYFILFFAAAKPNATLGSKRTLDAPLLLHTSQYGPKLQRMMYGYGKYSSQSVIHSVKKRGVGLVSATLSAAVCEMG